MMNLRSREKVVDNAQLAGRLCVDSVDLRAAHARHVATHGNLIPHAFMGDVLARAGACVVAGGAHSTDRRVELAGILATLEDCEGDKKKAAEVLGISLKTLYNRLNEYKTA